MINKKVLLLNQSYEPLMITNVKRAIILIMNKKVDLVEKYNDYVYTINSSLVAPSVIKLKYYIRFRKTIAPNRKNILKRDNYMCQYCMRVNVSLTIDHVIPKDKGGQKILNTDKKSLNLKNVDIVDNDLDKKVKRTKKRPIASGKISIFEALFYVIILCLLSLTILLQFNWLTISLGFGSMFFAFAYPFMKRITYWPQLFLGLTFNWGIIMGWTSFANQISIEP